MRKPPLESIELWATELGLTAEERARFRRLAMLEHTPDEIAAELLEVKARLAQLERNDAEIRRRLER